MKLNAMRKPFLMYMTTLVEQKPVMPADCKSCLRAFDSASRRSNPLLSFSQSIIWFGYNNNNEQKTRFRNQVLAELAINPIFFAI